MVYMIISLHVTSLLSALHFVICILSHESAALQQPGFKLEAKTCSFGSNTQTDSRPIGGWRRSEYSDSLQRMLEFIPV